MEIEFLFFADQGICYEGWALTVLSTFGGLKPFQKIEPYFIPGDNYDTLLKPIVLI